jgi:hypothetical protein
MAFWTLEQWLAMANSIRNGWHSVSAANEIFGIGKSVKEFVVNVKSGSLDDSGPASQVWRFDAHRAGARAALKHRHTRAVGRCGPGNDAHPQDRAALSSSLAFSAMLWELLQMTAPPEPLWWVEYY